MAMRKPPVPTMYAMVDCRKVLVPVEQLGIFESCMQVESAYEKDSTGEYKNHLFISEVPKLPAVELVSADQVTAWQVAGKLRAK